MWFNQRRDAKFCVSTAIITALTAGILVFFFNGEIPGSFLLPIVVVLLGTAMWNGRIASGKSLGILAVVAVIVRILFLAFPESDDVYRYIWEGMMQIEGYNPFDLAPSSPMLKQYAEWKFHGSINHPDFPTIYWPIAQFLFRGVASISHDPLAMKVVMMFFDLATAGLLYTLLPEKKKGWISLWFFNPVVLFACAGEGHLEIVAVFFTVLSYWFFMKKRYAGTFIAMALAVLVKVNFLLFLPLVFTRKSWKWTPLFLIPFLSFIPFIEPNVNPLTVPFRFGGEFAWNGPLFTLVAELIHKSLGYPFIGIVFLIGLPVIYLVSSDRRELFWGTAALFLLCTPTLHYWYLLMITPFLVLNRSGRWGFWVTIHLTIFFIGFFFHPSTEGIWKEQLFMQILAFLIPLAVGVWSKSKTFVTAESRDEFTGKMLSIVMPVLNESERIQTKIAMVKEQTPEAELIVVDGGSEDNTGELAEQAGATVLLSEKGRGIQIGTGVEQATREIVVVLHADSTPNKTTLNRIESVMNNGSLIGGSCGQVFDSGKQKFSLIQFLNALRAAVFGISFGDQLQFFRRELMAEQFPHYYLMEDVELALRMKSEGDVVYLPRGTTVSTRRWEHRGYFNNIITVVSLLGQFLFLRQFESISDRCMSFYKRYYG